MVRAVTTKMIEFLLFDQVVAAFVSIEARPAKTIAVAGYSIIREA